MFVIINVHIEIGEYIGSVFVFVLQMNSWMDRSSTDVNRRCADLNETVTQIYLNLKARVHGKEGTLDCHKPSWATWSGWATEITECINHRHLPVRLLRKKETSKSLWGTRAETNSLIAAGGLVGVIKYLENLFKQWGGHLLRKEKA